MIRMKLVRRDSLGTIYLSTRQEEFAGNLHVPGIISVDDITWRLSAKTGGQYKYEYGGFKVAPGILPTLPDADIEAVTIWVGTYFMFEGPARLQSWDHTGAVYSLVFDAEANNPLLDSGIGYDGNTVDFPMAFGTVEHVEPVRIADVASAPTYHLGKLIATTIAKGISGTADNGSGLTRVTTSAVHGFSTSDVVTIEGDITWTGAVTVIDTTNFDTALAYSAALSFGHAFEAGDFRAYDNAWPISGNVTDNADGTFSLSALPVGQVTMSGASVYSSTDGAVVWCAGRFRSLAFGDIGQYPQDMNFWATQQFSNPLDFLQEVFESRGLAFWYQSPGYAATTWTDIFVRPMVEAGAATPLNETVYGPDGYDVPMGTVDDTVDGVSAGWVRREASGSQLSETPKSAYAESVFPYGDRREIELHDIISESDINLTRLEDYIDLANRRWLSVPVPYSGVGNSIAGYFLSVEDRVSGGLTQFRSRGFQLNTRDYKMAIFGEVVPADPELMLHLIFENDPLYWDGSKFLDQSGNANHGAPQVAGPVWSTKTTGQDCVLFDKSWWLKVLHSISLNLTDEIRIVVDANLQFFMSKYPATYNGGVGYGFESAIGWISTVDFLGSHYLPHAETGSTWIVWEALFKGSTSYELKKDDVQTYYTTTSIDPLVGSTADLMIGQRADLAYDYTSIIAHKVRSIKIYNTIA